MSGPDLSHLLPEARAMAMRPDDERIVWIRSDRWVDYPAAVELLDELQWIIDQPARGRMRNGLILAESGMGKSMLLDRLSSANARRFDRVAGVRAHPALLVLMPPTPRPRDFLVQIYEGLGAPVPSTHTESKLQEGVIRLLRECGTRTLYIDEVNSVLAGSPLQQRAFLQLLRFLSNRLRLTLICAGTPEAGGAMMGDPQLRSRFADFELPPWRDDEALRVFLAHLVQNLPLRRPSPVDSPSLRKFVAEKSGGLTTPICLAYERAAVNAIRAAREMLERSSIEDPTVWRGAAHPGRGTKRKGG